MKPLTPTATRLWDLLNSVCIWELGMQSQPKFIHQAPVRTWAASHPQLPGGRVGAHYLAAHFQWREHSGLVLLSRQSKSLPITKACPRKCQTLAYHICLFLSEKGVFNGEETERRNLPPLHFSSYEENTKMLVFIPSSMSQDARPLPNTTITIFQAKPPLPLAWIAVVASSLSPSPLQSILNLTARVIPWK